MKHALKTLLIKPPLTEETVADLFQYSTDIVNIFNEKGVVLFTTPNVKKAIGFTDKELLGRSAFEFIHPEDIRKVGEVFGVAYANPGVEQLIEFRIRNKQGEWVSFESIGKSLKDKKANKFIFAISRNITHRKYVDDLIKDYSIKFKTVFEHARSWIYLINLNGKIIESNPAVLTLLGYTPDEIRDKVFTEITFPEDSKKDWNLFQKMVKGKLSHYQIDKRLIHKKGKIVWVSLSASMIRDALGRSLYGIGIAEDITEKVLQFEIRKQFASVISHEVKNPLAVISLNIQMLLNTRQEDEWVKAYQKRLKSLDSEIKRLTSTINYAIGVSQLTNENIQFNYNKVDLNELILSVVKNSNALIKTNKVKYKSVKNKIVVYAEEDRIKEVLDNLINNAVKYSPKKSDITITLSRKGKSTIVSVEDSGIGIPKNKIPFVFDLFYQGNHGKKGMGFGLYICKQIIDKHKGKIWVESEEGKGSTFVFSLPLLKE